MFEPGDGRPPCYASAGWFVTLATHEPRSRARIMGRSKGPPFPTDNVSRTLALLEEEKKKKEKKKKKNKKKKKKRKKKKKEKEKEKRLE
ncbi:hypothetical protein HZU73_01248 [Apis mellifera caucasica]|nr:hypothetical protein HZU73_01248 [Apis mellifera caucasica]KAG9435293.1 hypothetical protein HZU67_03278 [Apis mellifera carnica]